MEIKKRLWKLQQPKGSESDDSPSDSSTDVASALLKLMALFHGKSLRSGGVHCSSSCCQFASSLDSRSIDGLLLSSRSKKLFMASLCGGLPLNCSVEEFLMGLISFLDNISLRIFRTYSSRIFLRHQFGVCPFLWQ